jgi:type IV secretory pathway VirB2 component (pilin)
MLRRGGDGFPLIDGPEGRVCGLFRSSLGSLAVAVAAVAVAPTGLRAWFGPPGVIWKASLAGPKKISRIATVARSSTTSNPLKSSISTR